MKSILPANSANCRAFPSARGGSEWPPAPASYEQIAEFYDEDIGRNMSCDDIGFYIAQCARARGAGRVLEIGCGTGRISLPLAQAGLPVVGIDVCAPMLTILRRKMSCNLSADAARGLTVCRMDMRELTLGEKFAVILCPFSVFTYLTTPAEWNKVLEDFHGHLIPNGKFIVDVFIPMDRNALSANPKPSFDYLRPRADGTWIERTKMIEPAKTPGVNIVRRRYRFLDGRGAQFRQVDTVEHVHPWYPRRLQNLLIDRGFEVRGVYWDYTLGPRLGGERFVAFECRPR